MKILKGRKHLRIMKRCAQELGMIVDGIQHSQTRQHQQQLP